MIFPKGNHCIILEKYAFESDHVLFGATFYFLAGFLMCQFSRWCRHLYLSREILIPLSRHSGSNQLLAMYLSTHLTGHSPHQLYFRPRSP